MDIFIYNGFSELPSIDFNCLRIITFIKVNQVPVQINTGGNPARSPNGFLPYLQVDDGKRVIGGYDDIVAHFKDLGYGVVTEQEDFLATAYIQYFYENLYPCFQYILWGDPVNGDASRTLYAKRCPFPFNFTHPAKYTAHTDELLKIFGNFSINDKLETHNSSELLINAKISINLISTKLEKQNWFMGEKISEIDCTLYAYLAVLQHIGVSNNSLRTHINECPSLLKYTKQIRTQYLTGIAASTDSSVIFDRAKHLFITKEDGSVSPTLIKICAGVFAIGSMIMYAITHGLLEIAFDGDDSGDDYISHMDDTNDYDDE